MIKTFFLLCTFMIVFSSFVPDSFASCTGGFLGTFYTDAEHVFHGKVLDKNYFTLDYNPIVTFEVLESFKGNDHENISVSVDEAWFYFFEDGFEYVVFAYRDGLFLKTYLCWPHYHALPTSIELVRGLEIPDNEIHKKQEYFIRESFTPHELEKISDIEKIIAEKRLERYDEIYPAVDHFRMAVNIIAYLIPIAGSVGAFVYFLKKRRQKSSDL